MMFLTWIDDLDMAIPRMLRVIGCGICNLIYWLISKLFQLFMVVSQLNILSDDKIGPIYERVTLILTIVMVFYITFEFVKYVVQPDTMTDKEKGVGNIVKRMIIAIVLIAFVPRIFTMAYDLQNRLIRNQVFSKIILGEKNINFDTFGSAFSADMLGVFYGLDEEYCGGSNYDSTCQTAEAHVKANLEQLRDNGEVVLKPGLNDIKDMKIGGIDEKVFPIKFDGLMAIIVGGVILYLVILYTIDVGTRYAQLIFLQIMSPIAIIGYISPKKDNIFSKWLKQCTTTYLDLFIRLTIIYFILLIIDVLGDSFNSGTLFAGVEGANGYETLAYIALIMGLLVFAGKAPKMIGELLPGGGAASIGYGLKAGDRFTPTVNGVKRTFNAGRRTVGGAAGAIGGLYKGFKDGKKQKTWSALKAGFRGLRAGAGKGGGIRKGMNAARDSVNKDIDTADKGGTPFGHDARGGHYADIAKKQDRVVSKLDTMTTKKKEVSTAISEIKFRKQMDTIGDALKSSGNATAAREWDGKKKEAEKIARKFADGKINEDAFKTEMKNLVDTFNATHGLTGTSSAAVITDADLETTDTSKWGNIKIAINEAKKQAIDMLEEDVKYTNIDPTTEDVTTVEIKYDKSTNKLVQTTVVVDKNGTKKSENRKEIEQDDFAEQIGTISDIADNASRGIKVDPDYVKAHANADGASGKSGK